MVSANSQEGKDQPKWPNGAGRKTTTCFFGQHSTKVNTESSNQEKIYQLYKSWEKCTKKVYLLSLCQLNS